VVDQGWGADEVVVGVDATSATAAVYLPNGGPVTLRGTKQITLKCAIDLETRSEVKCCVDMADDKYRNR